MADRWALRVRQVPDVYALTVDALQLQTLMASAAWNTLKRHDPPSMLGSQTAFRRQHIYLVLSIDESARLHDGMRHEKRFD